MPLTIELAVGSVGPMQAFGMSYDATQHQVMSKHNGVVGLGFRKLSLSAAESVASGLSWARGGSRRSAP